ncbi:hypothetical protein D6B98_34095 [Bradyrhizobium sp. LVM 105]|uniref:Transposase n=1 Tax=Bradyrhizobium frederickii TaxID=2560054 RepID=A0A4Y9NM54_9BRAD|nr:hypothetical protein D6B98_34095 [Bradyrhizobium sp. LVM 105]TFV29787.1 hypothetical protein E4K66_36995 [Bradyrhizobium frederickii]TFV68442.1 hypothetical protein E4K64_36945 [Bradyrhizobium frederickii]
MQDDWDPEKIVRQMDELRVKLLCARSVIAECKAGLAELERRLERRAISPSIDERNRDLAATNPMCRARSPESRNVDDAIDKEGPVAFFSRLWDR